MGWTKRLMEEAEAQGYWPTWERICTSHIVSSELAPFVDPAESDGDDECVVCGATGVPMTEMDSLRSRVARLLATHWGRALDDLFFDNESESGFALVTPRTGTDLARDILECAVDDELLEEAVKDSQFDDGYWYRPSALWLLGSELISYSWEQFVAVARSQPPEVDLSALAPNPELMGEPADGIDPANMLARLTGLVAEHVGLTLFGTDHRWYRAVQVPESEPLSAARLGSAPPMWAAENRMSAKGVSMFYGADDAETAIAEFRTTPAGQRTVVGVWAPTRPLRLLDLARLDDVPSFFDVERAQRRDALMSLQTFSDDISVAVMPGDPPELAYRSTQAFTSHLQRHLPGIDGIVYSSSVNERPCCVLFADSEQCGDGAVVDGSPVLLVMESHSVHRATSEL